MQYAKGKYIQQTSGWCGDEGQTLWWWVEEESTKYKGITLRKSQSSWGVAPCLHVISPAIEQEESVLNRSSSGPLHSKCLIHHITHVKPLTSEQVLNYGATFTSEKSYIEVHKIPYYTSKLL